MSVVLPGDQSYCGGSEFASLVRPWREPGAGPGSSSAVPAKRLCLARDLACAAVTPASAPVPTPPGGGRPRARRGASVVALAIAMALVAAGCAGGGGSGDGSSAASPPTSAAVTTTTPTTPTTAAHQPLEVSAAVATAVDDAIGSDGLVRWPTGAALEVATQGSPTARDLEVLSGSLAAVGGATGLGLRPTAAADADITILFAPRPDWPVELRDVTDHVLGVTRTEWDADGQLHHSTVAVDSSIGQAARNQTILHELVHAVGLGHVQCPTSVVSGGNDGSPRWTLSPLDDRVLTTWYAAELDTGEPPAQVSAALTVVPGGPDCEPQALEAAETPDGTIWCEVRPSGSEPCVLVDGQGPEPSAPLADPTRWAVGGVVYDHDPDLYETFTFEGRRLLCERGGGRRPCQFTDGPGPLTAVDAWTDGQVVYEP